MIKPIAIEEALYGILHAAEILDYNEPMPYPTPRRIAALKACLEKPFATYGGRYLYWTLNERAAVLFYTIIKNHPLENGNKRSAVIITMFFLFLNGKTLTASSDQVYTLACAVAESPGGDTDRLVGALTRLFREYSVPISS